jgi:6-phosphogluconolactonase
MTEHDHGDLIILPDPAALAGEAARRFVELAQAAVADHGRFTVALSGGSTPRALHERLARSPLSESVDWANVHVFWGDERMVPPDDIESSYRMARETLLAHVPIPAANIYPVPTVGGTAEAAASAYEETLTAVFGAKLPRFDLILLGMGPDGHTASLFPDTDAAAITDRLVAAPYVPHLDAHRLTLTLPVLNAARQVAFMVAGADKQETLQAVWGAGASGDRGLPSSLVHPAQGTLTWLVDRAAAGSNTPR